jgi:hypothetical protein
MASEGEGSCRSGVRCTYSSSSLVLDMVGSLPVAAAAAHGLFCVLLSFAGVNEEAYDGGGLAGGSVCAGGHLSVCGVQGARSFFLLVCERGGINGTPGANLLVQAVGFFIGSGGLFVRSSASRPVAVDFSFLYHGCSVVSRCSFSVQGSSCYVGEAMTVVAFPMSGDARQHGRWTSSDSGGQLRRRGAPTMACTLEDWSCFSVIFLCSGVLFAKVWGEYVMLLCFLLNAIPFAKKSVIIHI